MSKRSDGQDAAAGAKLPQQLPLAAPGDEPGGEEQKLEAAAEREPWALSEDEEMDPEDEEESSDWAATGEFPVVDGATGLPADEGAEPLTSEFGTVPPDGGMDAPPDPEETTGEFDVDLPAEQATGQFAAVDLNQPAPGGDLEEVSDGSFADEALSPRQSMIVGAVLGAAIGDAIGHPTEFIGSFEAIRDRYGPEGVTGFELYWDRDGGRFAPYTDDTQMAEVVLRSLLESRDSGEDLDAAMQRIGRGFVQWADHPQGGHRAPGNACLAGCRALASGAHWSKAGGAAAGGCGSVMRAYPFGLVFAHDPQRAERWSMEHSKLTHRDPIALAGSAAMAVAMAAVMRGESVDRVLSEMVAAACRYCANTASMVARAIHEARTGVEPGVTLKRLEGWAAHEAIAAAAYLFARHPDDARAAILEGANTPGDSDSLATLAGALVGARVGVENLPEQWVEDIERSDDLWALALLV